MKSALRNWRAGKALAEVREDLETERETANQRALTIQRLEDQVASLTDEVAALRADNARLLSRAAELELRLCEGAGCRFAGGGANGMPPLDLCRRRILYVGGMTRAVTHMRDLVMRHNGEFIHHDGGLEDGCTRLAGALSQADAVLCPVTCVSHNAINTIKRDCRRACKAFLPLPSHSVSALERALRVVARSVPEPTVESS